MSNCSSFIPPIGNTSACDIIWLSCTTFPARIREAKPHIWSSTRLNSPKSICQCSWQAGAIGGTDSSRSGLVSSPVASSILPCDRTGLEALMSKQLCRCEPRPIRRVKYPPRRALFAERRYFPFVAFDTALRYVSTLGKYDKSITEAVLLHHARRFQSRSLRYSLAHSVTKAAIGAHSSRSQAWRKHRLAIGSASRGKTPKIAKRFRRVMAARAATANRNVAYHSYRVMRMPFTQPSPIGLPRFRGYETQPY